MLILRQKIHTHKSKPVFEVLYLEKWCGSEVCKMNVTGSVKRLSYKIPSELFRKKSRLYYAQVCVSLPFLEKKKRKGVSGKEKERHVQKQSSRSQSKADGKVPFRININSRSNHT